MKLHELTKEQLIALHKRLSSENERLESELDNLSDSYAEMENQLADAVNLMDDENVIKDVRLFKFKLELNGLMTQELEDFIDIYMKYYNEIGSGGW